MDTLYFFLIFLLYMLCFVNIDFYRTFYFQINIHFLKTKLKRYSFCMKKYWIFLIKHRKLSSLCWILNFIFFVVCVAMVSLQFVQQAYPAAVPKTCINPSAVTILQNPCDDHADKIKPTVANQSLQVIGKHSGDLQVHVKSVLEAVVCCLTSLIYYLKYYISTCLLACLGLV